jgi:predicted  nucleic acid-binding Zn ribbon protein
MFLSKIVFGNCDDSRGETTRSDIVEDYLVALLHNGQILGDYFFAPFKAELVVYTHVARPSALAKQYHSKWGLSSLRDVVKAFGQLPACEIIQDDVPERFPSWKKSSFLYLFTHAFDDMSPVCCGDSGRPIPVYLLPISDQTREDLYFWARHFKDHDNIWLASGALEIPAYKQTADPRSELSSVGRELCKEIESATDKKTFYYLHRYWGRNVGEQDRPCPICGHRWRTSKKEKVSKELPFWNFWFRCVRCRLVSHCADSYDNERHAVIGEYPRQKPHCTKPTLNTGETVTPCTN